MSTNQHLAAGVGPVYEAAVRESRAADAVREAGA